MISAASFARDGGAPLCAQPRVAPGASRTEMSHDQPVDEEQPRLNGRRGGGEPARTKKVYAASGALSSVAKTPGQGPAQRLVATTAPKKEHEGSALPVRSWRAS